MTASELARLDSELSVQLPEYYRATMLAYPFVGRGDIEQAELVDSIDLLLELNGDSPAATGNGAIFVIGTDQSEETYYIKPNTTGTSVYCFELETGKHRKLCTSWDEYMALCAKQIEEAEADERLMAENDAKTKWWHVR